MSFNRQNNTRKPSTPTLDVSNPLTRGIVAAYVMNEGGGTKALDIGGVATVGTFSGTVPYWATSKFGAAGSFNGTDAYFQTNKVPYSGFQQTNPITVSCWIKTVATTTGVIAGTWQFLSNAGWRFTINDNSAGFLDFQMLNQFGSNLRNCRGSVTVNDGKWHHVVITYSGNSSTSGVTFYTDGAVNSTTSTGNTDPSTFANAGFVVGVSLTSTVPSQYFNGGIDNLVIYNRVLSASEIQQLYVQPFSYLAPTPRVFSNAAPAPGASLAAGAITLVAKTDTTMSVILGTISGGTAPYSTQFKYSTSTNGTYTNIGSPVAGTNPTSPTQTGLTAGTQYFFRAVVTDSASTVLTQPSATTGTAFTTYSAMPNNANINYSGRWNVQATAATTINCGAGFDFSFSGSTTCQAIFTNTGLSAYPDIYYQIDDDTPTRVSLSSGTNSFTAIPDTATSAHRIRVWAAGIYEGAGGPAGNVDQWNSQLAALTLLGIQLDAGATILANELTQPTMEFLGDSVTATVRLYYVATSDQTVMDGYRAWAQQVARKLGYQCVLTGFGGQGPGTAGSGGVPACTAAFPYVYNGVAYSPSVLPSVVVVMQGYNNALALQATATFQPLLATYLSTIRTAYPLAQIFVITPPNIDTMKAGYSTAIAGAVSGLSDAAMYNLNYNSGVVGSIGGTDYSDPVAHLNLGGNIKLASQLMHDIQAQLTTSGFKPQLSGGGMIKSRIQTGM